MSEKIQIIKSESRRGCYRVILNVNEDYSVGSVCSPAELQSAVFQIQQALNTEVKKNQIIAGMGVFLSDSERETFVELLNKIDDPQYIQNLVSQVYNQPGE